MSGFKRTHLSTIVTVALLIALSVILTHFLSINTAILRIGFGILPIAIAGIAYGPFWGAVTGTVADVLGMIIYPTGQFFPGFTLTSLLSGVIFALFLYGKPVTLLRLFLASATVCIALNLVLDTLWLSIMYGNAFAALLPARAVKCVINIPVYALILKILWSNALSKIPQFRSN